MAGLDGAGAGRVLEIERGAAAAGDAASCMPAQIAAMRTM